MTRTFLVDMFERVIWTFLQAFAAAIIVTSGANGGVNWTDVKLALVAAGISAAKCLVASTAGV